MNPKALARVAITLIGIYALIWHFGMVFQALAMLFAALAKRDYNELRMVPLIAGLLILMALILRYVVLKPDWLIQAATANVESIEESPASWGNWYRLAFIIAGALILAGTIPSVWSVLAMWYYSDMLAKANMRGYEAGRQWFNVFSILCRFALGIYLIMGAPKLLNWHIRQLQRAEQV